MKIVLLSGPPNSGKTTVLGLFYTHLIANGASVHTKKSQLGGNKNDFECILILNGKSIAIFTMGDYKEECYRAIIKYASCDILVIAYSDTFSKSIANFVSSIPHHTVIQKTRGDQILSNKGDVKALLNHI
jgi:thymidylate kinase